MEAKRYNLFSEHLKERLGGRIHKISVDAGFSCPNRGGTRRLPGCLFCAADYVQAQAARRMLTREMLDLLGDYDLLVTAGSGPAPELATASANRAIDHWTRPNPETPFSVTGVPAMSVCNGFTCGGLPLAMQIAGRPFDEAMVLRVGHAYEQAAQWHRLHPQLEPSPRLDKAVGARATNERAAIGRTPAAAATSKTVREQVDPLLERSGLTLTDDHRALLYRLAPVALAAAYRIRSLPG